MVAADTSHKLLEFERLFKNRYTEHDSDYQKALQGQRLMTNVPLMDPWPPRMKPFGGKQRFNRNRDRERIRHSNRGGHQYPRDYGFTEQERVNDYHHSHTRDSHSVSNDDIHNTVDDRWTTYQEDSHQHDSIITNNIPSPLPLPMQPPLDAFKDSPSKPVTEHDVEAILLNVKSSNPFDLKKEKERQKHKLSQKTTKTGTTAGNQLLSADAVPSFNNTRIPLKKVDSDKVSVRHGSAEPIATSVLLSEHYSRKAKKVQEPQRHKRKHSVLEDDKSDSENEHIDVEGGFVPRLTVDSPLIDINQVTMKQPFYANNVDYGSRNKSFIVHVPLKQLSLKCTKLPVDVCIRSFEQRLPEDDDCNDVSNDSNVHLEQQRIKKEKKKHRRREKKAAKKLKLNKND